MGHSRNLWQSLDWLNFRSGAVFNRRPRCGGDFGLVANQLHDFSKFRRHSADGDPRFWPVKGLCFAKVRGNPAYDCSQQPSNLLADSVMGGREG